MQLSQSRYFSMLLLLLTAISRSVPTQEAVSPVETTSAMRHRFCFAGLDRNDSIQREKDAFRNLPLASRFWLTEDALELISQEEKCVFLHLKTDDERNQFIEQFWLQ